jgi:hypothetical protein
MTINPHRRLQICRLLSRWLPFLVVVGATGTFLYRQHYVSHCALYPEECRPSGGEVQP